MGVVVVNVFKSASARMSHKHWPNCDMEGVNADSFAFS